MTIAISRGDFAPKNFPGWGWVVGSAENKANSAQLELEAGAELGNKKATSRQLGFDLIIISLVPINGFYNKSILS